MVRIFVAVALIAVMVAPARADFSSMTQAERVAVENALGMAWEYKALLDGAERRRIVEAVRVDGDSWRVRIELAVPKKTGGERIVLRDVIVKISPPRSGPEWVYIVASAAVGLAVGLFINRK